MNAQLSGYRLGLTLRADAQDVLRRTLLASAAIGGVVMLLSLTAGARVSFGANPYLVWFGWLLFLWGLDVTSRAFTDMHDRSRNEAFVLLPASSVEKALSRLLLSTALFVVWLLVFTWAVSALTELLRLAFFGHSRALFRPWDPAVWVLLAHYLPVQALFFAGAAWFRRNPLIKTVLVLLAIAVLLLVVAWLLLRIFGPAWFDGLTAWPLSGEADLEAVLQRQQRLVEVAGFALQAVWFVLLPPFCWALAWLRVREVQVSDGV